MNQVIYKESKQKVPIKLWLPLEHVEHGALEQALNLSNLPFAYKHIAIMPDTHQGYGMPIGGVLATEEVVIPNAVGVDIGCGMCTVKTTLEEINTDTLKKIMGKIRDVVPVGFNHQKESQIKRMSMIPARLKEDLKKFKKSVVMKEFSSACYQLGTLGGGNHFIEMQKGDDEHIWIMIHSGSRNLGKKVADHYNKAAKELNKKFHVKVPESFDLAYLPVDHETGKLYLLEMAYCLEFARANRFLMMDRVKAILFREFKGIKFGEIINIHHNYAGVEKHFGRNVIVHRKGATSAREGQLGIIPGSQGTKSYIVRGKGNRESFHSCSHGAGRTMSRKKARAELSLEEERNKLDKQGIIHSVRHKRDLDETSSAYKDIDVVMENQKDLVDIETQLTPLGVIKG